MTLNKFIEQLQYFQTKGFGETEVVMLIKEFEASGYNYHHTTIEEIEVAKFVSTNRNITSKWKDMPVIVVMP